MARNSNCIQKISRHGETTYKVAIRRRGFPSVFKSFDRYADAEAFRDRALREQESRAAHGCNVGLTVVEVVTAYRESDEFKALRSDRSRYLEYWETRLGTSRVASLNRNVFQHEAEVIARGGAKPRSKATVAVYMSALGTILDYGARKMFAHSNALAEWRVCSFSVESKVRGRALEPDEVRALLAAADKMNWHWPLVVRLLLLTAGRRGEILNRKRRDVVFGDDGAVITVERSKNGERRTMVVPPGEVCEGLKARCEGLCDDDLLFPGRKPDKPIDPKKGWANLIEKAGLAEDVTMHWLRKTAATTLLRAGVDIASVAKVTGHKTHAVLLKHYASAGEARQREVVARHAALLLGLPAPAAQSA